MSNYKKLKLNNRTVQYKDSHIHYTEYAPFGIQSVSDTTILPIVYGIKLTVYQKGNSSYLGKAVCLLSDSANHTLWLALKHDLTFSIPIQDVYRLPNLHPESKYTLSVFIPQFQNSYTLKFESFQDKDQFVQGMQELTLEHVTLNATQTRLSYFETKEVDVSRQFGQWFEIDPANAQLILENFNLHLSLEYISFIFFREENVCINLSDLLEFYKLLHEFPFVEKLFIKYNSEIIQRNQINLKCFINENSLKQFFQSEMYLPYIKSPPLKHKVNYYQFMDYLFSKANRTEVKPSLYQNMSQTLDKYVVFGCKNVFDFSIPKKCLKALASLKTAIDDRLVPLYHVIKQGVRYFEFEVWDGKEEPQCNCQRSFSTITFREITQFMQTHLFETNPFPVIIHIESHCSQLQNTYIKVLLDQAFTSRLIVANTETVQSQELPRLDQLKGKVLISSTILAKSSQANISQNYEGLIISFTENNNVSDNLQYFQYQNQKYQPQIRKQQLEQSSKLLDSQNQQVKAYQQIQKYVRNDVHKISVLYQIKDFDSIYKWCIHCAGGDNVEDNDEKSCLLSKVDTSKKLGTNINSFQCILEKFQIMPVEHHILDTSYMYLWSLFRANNKSGYIELQARETEYDLVVKVILGYQLKNKKHCSIGTSQIEIMLLEPKKEMEQFQSYFSQKIKMNTINPYFEEEFRFRILQSNLSVVVFKVYIDDVFTSWNGVAVESIQQGFRRVDLRDSQLNKISQSFLMCDIKFLQYV